MLDFAMLKDIAGRKMATPAARREAALGEADLPHVVCLGAVQDDELALELAVEGKTRGALSWAFARALRGQADRDGDSALDTRELEL